MLVRPSFVIGGRAMAIVHTEERLKKYMQDAVQASPDKPILVDKFLADAVEVDVDCLCDGDDAVIAGIMEHIEQAGVHSGDSACVTPPFSISKDLQKELEKTAIKLALELKIVGLLNIQFAIRDDKIFIIEANPRASRTVPFISKAVGIPYAKLATELMLGKKISEIEISKNEPDYFAVKEVIFPFIKFPGIDISLSPEMKSTGEAMGIDKDLGMAFAKSQLAVYSALPKKGGVYINCAPSDSKEIVQKFTDLGFSVYLPPALHDEKSILAHPSMRPNVFDFIKQNKINLVISIFGNENKINEDEKKIRSLALSRNVLILTTNRALQISLDGISALSRKEMEVKSLQDYYK